MRLGVFGDVVLDLVVLHREEVALDSDSRAGITPTAGGSAANVAAWAARASRAARTARASRAGLDVSFFGQAGDDIVGRQLKADLAAEGVSVDAPSGNFVLTGAAPTGIIIVNVQGEDRTMVTDRGANLCPPADLVRPEALGACDWFHLTGYSLFEPGPREVALAVLAGCRRLGLPFSADPSSYRLLREFGAERFLADVEGASVLFPNRDEAKELTGLDDPSQASAWLTDRFPVVVVKLGAEGCLVATGGRAATGAGAATGAAVEAVPAADLSGPAVDPTGAGDAFAAGFLAGWLGAAEAGRAKPAAHQGAKPAAHQGAMLAARQGAKLAAQAVLVVGGRGRGRDRD